MSKKKSNVFSAHGTSELNRQSKMSEKQLKTDENEVQHFELMEEIKENSPSGEEYNISPIGEKKRRQGLDRTESAKGDRRKDGEELEQIQVRKILSGHKKMEVELEDGFDNI